MHRSLGIPIVDVREIVKAGRKLHYRADDRLVEIDRIYNRVIVDELERKGITLPFAYDDDLDVEWAGHPNWYFRISKFSIPYLHHPSVPAAVFLDDYFAGKGRELLPQDRANWVFKPLYSFAGKGIQFGPTDEDLLAVPASERHNYLLQERVFFEPVIRTPGRHDTGRDSYSVCVARRPRYGGDDEPGADGARADDGRGPQSRPDVGGWVGGILSESMTRGGGLSGRILGSNRNFETDFAGGREEIVCPPQRKRSTTNPCARRCVFRCTWM